MTYRRRAKNGMILLEAGVRLCDGMDVRVEPATENQNAAPGARETQQLEEGLQYKDWPADFVRNHGCYVREAARE